MKLFAIAALLAAGARYAQNAPGLPSAAAPATWKLATGYRAESFHTQNILQFSREWVRSVGNEDNAILVPDYLAQ